MQIKGQAVPLDGTLATELTMPELRMRFCELEILVQADSEKYLDFFVRMYRRFLLDPSTAFQKKPVEFAIWSDIDNPWRTPAVVLDGEVQFLKEPRLLQAYVYESILYAVLEKIRDDFLIHGGVVSSKGQGVIIAADSMHGKTTLALELVRRGFKFLSDDIAALGRQDHWVHPFPRSLRVRPGTLELVGFPQAVSRGEIWFDRLIIDVEDIKSGSLGEAVPITNIVILRDPAEPAELVLENSSRMLSVMVDRMDNTLFDAVAQIQGVSRLRAQTRSGYPMLELFSADRTAVFARIESLCKEKQILILGIIKRKEQHPSFDQAARLEPIPVNQAALELIKRFQGGPRSALLVKEFGNSPTRLFMELTGVIQQANCYQLFVGPLKDMADLVCGLIKE